MKINPIYACLLADRNKLGYAPTMPLGACPSNGSPRDRDHYSGRLLVHYSIIGITFLIWSLTCGSLFPDDGESLSPGFDPLLSNQLPWVKSAREGNTLWEAGDEEGAVRKWEAAIAQGFSDGMAFYYLGRYYARKEEWEKVITYLRKAKPRVEAEKGDSEVMRSIYEMLGIAYMNEGDYYESYIHYQKALRLDPDSPSLHLGLANLLLLRGKIDAAEREARRVLETDPDNAGIYWILGIAAEKRGDYAAAVDYYRKFLARESDRWDVRLTLGLLLLFHFHQNDAAEQELLKVVKLAPDDARAYAALGEIYLKRDDFKSAREEAERALRIDPKNYQAQVTMGMVYLREGDDVTAEKYFKDALRDKPGGALALYGMGVVLFNRREYREAEGYFRGAISLVPDFREAALNRGLVLEAMGRREEALKQLRKVVSRNPDFAPAQLNLGKIYYYSGEARKALPFFMNALALDRASWEPFFFIGKCLIDDRKNEDALEYLLAARELNPDNPALLTELGVAYERTNRLDLAESTLEEAVANNPGYMRAILKLGLLKARRRDSSGADRLYRQALVIQSGDISWGYQGEQKEYLARLVSDLEEYLGAGIDYLSLYAVMKNISRERGVFAELIPVLKKKVGLYPLRPEYSHLLGLAYLEDGKLEDAEKYFSHAVRIDSDFAAAHLSLGQLYAQQGRYGKAREHFEAVLALDPDSLVAPTVRNVLEKLPE